MSIQNRTVVLCAEWNSTRAKETELVSVLSQFLLPCVNEVNDMGPSVSRLEDYITIGLGGPVYW